MRVYKFLYADDTIEEKASAIQLEKATQNTTFCTAFTVVSNPFTALECTEHTHFSAIFLAHTGEKLNSLTPFDFQRILRNVGANTPIILVLDKFECVPDYVFDENNGFPHSRTLIKPYSDRQLCEVITNVLFPNAEEQLEGHEGHAGFYLQNSEAEFHTLDYFDEFGFDHPPQVLIPTAPASKTKKSKVSNARNKMPKNSVVSSNEVKRQRTSSSSTSSNSVTSVSNVFATKEAMLAAVGHESSSSSLASTDFDPDTVFQDDHEI